jgi:hypothetical protein
VAYLKLKGKYWLEQFQGLGLICQLALSIYPSSMTCLGIIAV